MGVGDCRSAVEEGVVVGVPAAGCERFVSPARFASTHQPARAARARMASSSVARREVMVRLSLCESLR
jgi:hypothetical protein